MADKLAFERMWLGLEDVDVDMLANPLGNRTELEKQNPGLREFGLMTTPEYLFWTAKILLGVELLPLQAVILEELWIRSFPMLIMSRGGGKSFLLALYAMLKLLLTPATGDGSPGAKIVITGAAFRQSKIIFEYMEGFWRNAPIAKDMCDERSGTFHSNDMWTFRVNNNVAYAIPMGSGEKIRGLRANIIIADEFSAIAPHIYETVVQGFAAVHADPIENVKRHAMRAKKQRTNSWTDIDEERFQSKKGNQIIISGTADYDFKHFSQYWRRYKAIITSRGNAKILAAKFKDLGEEAPTGLNYKQYSIIRIPQALIPVGFMDADVLARAKATIHSGAYQQEYDAVFSKDSTGFFKSSLIEACVASDQKPILLNGEAVWFNSCTRGSLSGEYVYGVDPASEKDNFAIVVVQVMKNHQRVVYTWTTNRRDFKQRQKEGLTKVGDYYGFCARKIRDLMKVFPLAQHHPKNAGIALDKQGGGIAILEALQDPDKMKDEEQPLLPTIDPDKEADTDDIPGLHVIEVIQFSSADWTSYANHSLRKDFEDRLTLFPQFDQITLGLSMATDFARAEEYKEKYGKKLTIFDSLEDCALEIEELKNELATIMMSMTGTGVGGRERWDTPEYKMDDGRKGRLRKDRYSALLMANTIAREINRRTDPVDYDVIGGFVSDIPPGQDNAPMYGSGPTWFKDGMQEMFSGGEINTVVDSDEEHDNNLDYVNNFFGV